MFVNIFLPFRKTPWNPENSFKLSYGQNIWIEKKVFMKGKITDWRKMRHLTGNAEIIKLD